MKAIRLKTEYLGSPVGLDILKPRFSWNCEGGKKQTAYRIEVKCESGVLWDSGKVESDKMTNIEYAGHTLKSRMAATWNVCLWDENGEQGEQSSSCFEMGLLEKSDWKADWITGDYKPKKNKRYPVDCFLKNFRFTGMVKKARLYISACGVYDVTINGKRIEDFILAPGSTDYCKRIQYQVYDVTKYIEGNNKLEIRVADGWYRGNVAAYSIENFYGVQTGVIAQLETENTQGEKRVVCTDGSWKWSNDGQLSFADLKDGEVYDANKKPSYSGVAKVIKKDVNLVSSNNVYVKEKENYIPEILTAKDGTRVLDFKQNIAGYLKFIIKGKKGQTVKFVAGEVLNSDGRVNLSGIQCKKPLSGWSGMKLIKMLLGAEPKKDYYLTPKQEIVFTCSGEEDEYKTSFAVFGFRYVEVIGDINIIAEDFTAIAVYSDMERTGYFNCSDSRVNKLYENTVMSMKGNFLDVPTDCPTRERLGWTGDAQLFFNTGAYLFDASAFFKKWLKDMRDSQYKNGLIPAVLPLGGVNGMGAMMYKATGSSVGWADAIYLIPYRYYKRYNDINVLKDNWEMIKRYTDYLMSNTGLKDKKAAKSNPYNKYTYEKGVHLGEWLEPEQFRDKVYGTKAKHPEECTAYLHYTMKTVSEIAEILGYTDYKQILDEYAEGAKNAYEYLFISKGECDTDRQAKLVRPLALGLTDGETKKGLEERLVKAVENYNFRVGTGFLSTPFLLLVLTEAGRSDIAYKVLLNEQLPGWLCEVKAGATTVWEDWEGKFSQNHYSLGAVTGWLFDTVAGIKVTGENAFEITPVAGEGLDFAEVSYLSPYGKISSHWEKKDGKVIYKFEIPANTTANIELPDGRTEAVGSGIYSYEV